ncbi:MAG: DUF3795 domain-containing protein [bacterium]|nr:DUF3795 domain-containing protein [bacterium]
MGPMISACGLQCDQCNYFGKTCQGCYAVQGEPFWAKEMMPDKLCPLYKCAIIDKKYTDCGQCPELPCKLFNDLKDPSISEQEHIKSINERVSRLKERLQR